VVSGTVQLPEAAADAVPEAVAAYHDLLSDDMAADSQAVLDDQLRRRGLFFGDRPLCTVLRPRFLSPAQFATLRLSGAALLRAFARAHRAAMADAEFRAQFGLLDWEESLLGDDPGFPDPSPTSRLDAFFTADGMRFTEYNAETPAGAAYNDALTEVFYGLPVMRAFLRRYRVQPLPARYGVTHALLDAFEAWSGRRERPRIGILDWGEVPTYSEFRLYHDHFASQGLESAIVDPREVDYRNGRLTAGDFHITLIYKRVLISELVERGGIDHPVVRAVRERAVCMVNPFRCKILHKKASLAVLSDERNAHLFESDELAAIAAHIPWTRVVEERTTSFRGARVDLTDMALDRREELVLKPNDEYGGKGIVLGWEVDATTWERALHAALQEPYIIQERIVLPYEPYPSVADGQLVIVDRMLDTAPFVQFGRHVDSCLTRLSTAALLNVTAGGGSSVASFLIEKR
jgi:uncharacterized circularly permuted ATP-grasp superfamily protein